MTEDKDKNTRIPNGKILSFSRDASLYAKRGDAKRAQNDLISAISMYSNALEQDPDDLDARLTAAEILTDMSRFNDSNKLVIPYMHKDEDFRRDAYCLVGFNLMGLGEYEGARGCFNRFFDMTDEVSERTDAILDALDLIDSTEVDPPLLTDAALAEREEKLQRAHDAFDSGDFEASAGILRELVAKDPDDKKALYDAALSCLCIRNMREGEAHIDHLLELDENNWAALSMKLLFAKSANNEIEMAKVVKRLEKCDTDDAEVLLRVNGALLETGYGEQAAAIGQRLVRLLPYDNLTNHRLAASFILTGQYKKAGEIYEKLLRIDSADKIARFYRDRCAEAGSGKGRDFSREKPMIQYQLPFDGIIAGAKALLDNRDASPASIRDRWKNEPDYRETVRWAFTLHEINITHVMLNLLMIVGDAEAETMIRSVLADIDVDRRTANDAMGTLKRMQADEPFFAVIDGALLEGRVNVVDLSKVHIPKQYMDIFPRFRSRAEGLYSDEVIRTGAEIADRFIASTRGNFSRITNGQSEALSAGLEFLACDRVGVLVRDDAMQRYGVSRRRLMNAIERLVRSMLSDETEDDGGEG